MNKSYWHFNCNYRESGNCYVGQGERPKARAMKAKRDPKLQLPILSIVS